MYAIYIHSSKKKEAKSKKQGIYIHPIHQARNSRGCGMSDRSIAHATTTATRTNASRRSKA